MKQASLLRSSLPTASRLLALVLVLLVLAGCHKFQARLEFKAGNGLYRSERYRDALTQFQKGLALDPGATFAWRSVGLTAMALYRPGIEGEENEHLADVAIDAFEKYERAYPNDPRIEEYLITVLINAERYEEALARLERKARAGDPTAGAAIVNVMVKAGRLPAAFERAHRLGASPDPQLLYTIGVAAWASSYSDATLNLARRSAVVELGLNAIREALDLKPDYFEAMAYYNLLFREKAKVTIDPLEQQKCLALADDWMHQAIALRDRQLHEESVAAQPTRS